MINICLRVHQRKIAHVRIYLASAVFLDPHTHEKAECHVCRGHPACKPRDKGITFDIILQFYELTKNSNHDIQLLIKIYKYLYFLLFTLFVQSLYLIFIFFILLVCSSLATRHLEARATFFYFSLFPYSRLLFYRLSYNSIIIFIIIPGNQLAIIIKIITYTLLILRAVKLN